MIKREIIIFLLVGTLTVVIDFISYHCLIEIMGINMAKATGFLIGASFSYLANRYWTFAHKSQIFHSAWRFAVLYTSTLGVNVIINTIALKLFIDIIANVQLAFLLATGGSTCINFFGMKMFVFKTIVKSEI